jgi:DNA polymerase-1
MNEQCENRKKSLYLIDGSSYIYRAFYALGRLTNSRGMPTQAIYGFAQMILKVVREKKPDLICMVFDASGPTFRHEAYNAYKATRQQMPEDLAVQVPYIKELVRYHGIPQTEVPGYEADDIIAALTQWAVEQDLDVVIVSGDKDLHQLIEDSHVQQWDPQKDRVFTEQGVAERFGVTPRQMADYLALVGDSSDNIPGVKGVGEKTARQLLQQWGTLDEILNHIEDIPSAALRKKLQESRDMAHLSKRLVLFKTDAPVARDINQYLAQSPMLPELMKLYEELDFRGLLKTLRDEWEEPGEASPLKSSGPSRSNEILTTVEQLSELVRRIEEAGQFSIDLETTSPDPMSAKLVGIALSFGDHEAYYVPVGHDGAGSGGQLLEKEVLGALEPLLIAPRPEKMGQNIKYEWVVFKRYGITLKGIAFDTMVASYLLDPGKFAHGLERIAAEYLGETVASYTDITGKGKAQVAFARVDINKAADYACCDAETTWRLVPILRDKLQESKLEDLYGYLELPLIEILAKMEYAGILVDAGRLETLSLEFEKAMDQKAAVIYDLGKEEFNIQSPKQLAYILFEKLGLRVIKKTKTGPSTDISVLEVLALEHPIVDHVLAYRSLAKLKGTYVDALARLIHPETGRIHTSYNQTVTATGRLSSSDPNLQNIPIRSEEGRKIREAFIAAPGHVLLSADYSQIELRLLAHYSQDKYLLEAFHSGEDVHRHTAAEMLSIPPHQVTPEMRRQAKTINFGIIYGMGAFGLAQRLRISNKMARAAIERYFERYEGVKRFIESTVAKTRKLGYCETMLGRRRAIPELQSRNRTIQQQGERLAVNTPLQGTAADLIKKAMIDIDMALEKSGLRASMLLQVHDELVFEVPLDELEATKKLVQEEMETIWDLSVPLKVDLGWGENWAKAHP